MRTVHVPSWVDVPLTPPDLQLLRLSIATKHSALDRTQRELETAVASCADEVLAAALAENAPILARFVAQLAVVDGLLAALSSSEQSGATLFFVRDAPGVEPAAAGVVATSGGGIFL